MNLRLIKYLKEMLYTELWETVHSVKRNDYIIYVRTVYNLNTYNLK